VTEGAAFVLFTQAKLTSLIFHGLTTRHWETLLAGEPEMEKLLKRCQLKLTANFRLHHRKGSPLPHLHQAAVPAIITGSLDGTLRRLQRQAAS